MTTVQESTFAATEGTTTPTVKHWINGAENEGATGQTQPIFNPSNGEVIGHVALGDATTVDQAVWSATLAQKSRGRTSLARRTAILFRMRELMLAHDLELGEIISAEHGKTVGVSSLVGSRSRPGWSESTRRSRCRSATSRSAAGRTRSSATTTLTVPRVSASNQGEGRHDPLAPPGDRLGRQYELPR